MASVDLKDAYYSIPIAEEDRKLLMFQWKGKYYQFTCLTNGPSSAHRIFTKILKPVYARLRSIGHTCMGHIDDSLLVGQSFNSCHRNIADTVCLFANLGFTIHPVKSVLQPQLKNRFSGFCTGQYHDDSNPHRCQSHEGQIYLSKLAAPKNSHYTQHRSGHRLPCVYFSGCGIC